MPKELPKVSVAVRDRILLHLLENFEQADQFMVTSAVTRPGIAEACALHPPNVSRTMRSLLKEKLVQEHSRMIKNDERRQKVWQLTEVGKAEAQERRAILAELTVLIRGKDGDLLEIKAEEVAERLEANLTLMQVLMHAIHEGVLTYGDIRFGPIQKKDEEGHAPPGRLTLLAGAHATYHTRPPKTRPVHGRADILADLDTWRDERHPCMIVQGVAGIGKSTVVAHWLQERMDEESNLSICWYPCQPWDREHGIAVSLLHRVGVDDVHDPYQLMDTLPLSPGASLDVDAWRRRLLAYLTDSDAIRERYRRKEDEGKPPPTWLIILDDVHHMDGHADELLGSLLQVAVQSPLQLLMISRTRPKFYDRRDVHTRDKVREVTLKGLSVEALKEWLSTFKSEEPPEADMVHQLTGGHPLAMELLELYGAVTHRDWLRFLDEEILDALPNAERELLAQLAVSQRPVKWKTLAEASGWQGKPPERLLAKGLLIELPEGMWLHEALRERLLQDVGSEQDERRQRLNSD
ncbi:MAG: hypothetical protein CMB49_05990 [Euryarchaeota archaeon]|nr:hypothetical protein [Euryarchaeota archaeon]